MPIHLYRRRGLDARQEATPPPAGPRTRLPEAHAEVRYPSAPSYQSQNALTFARMVWRPATSCLPNQQSGTVMARRPWMKSHENQ